MAESSAALFILTCWGPYKLDFLLWFCDFVVMLSAGIAICTGMGYRVVDRHNACFGSGSVMNAG